MTVVACLGILGFMIGTFIFCLCDPRKSKEDPETYQRLEGEDFEEEAAGDKGEQQDDDNELFGKGK